MDTVALTNELHKEISYLTDERFQFAFTWSPVKGIDGRIFQCAKQAVQMQYRHQQKKNESDDTILHDYRRWKSDLCPICKL